MNKTFIPLTILYVNIGFITLHIFQNSFQNLVMKELSSLEPSLSDYSFHLKSSFESYVIGGTFYCELLEPSLRFPGSK